MWNRFVSRVKCEMLKIKSVSNVSKIDLVLKVLAPGVQKYKLFHIRTYSLIDKIDLILAYVK